MAESPNHLALKELVAAAAQAAGWDAAPEVSGISPSGKRWRADVVATKAGKRVAFEVQWSGQAHTNFLERSAPYLESGLEVVWLHRSTRFEVTEAVVEARIRSDSDHGYLVALPGAWGQSMPVHEFVDAVLANRLEFGLPAAPKVNVTVFAADANCWEEKCDGRYQVIPYISLSFGPQAWPTESASINLDELGQVSGFEELVLDELADLPIATYLRSRYSRTREEAYLSCGCPKCDRIAGAFYMHDYLEDALPLKTFQMALTPSLKEWLLEHDDLPYGWMVT